MSCFSGLNKPAQGATSQDSASCPYVRNSVSSLTDTDFHAAGDSLSFAKLARNDGIAFMCSRRSMRPVPVRRLWVAGANEG